MSGVLRTVSLIGRSALGSLGRFLAPRWHRDRAASGGLRGRLFRKYVLMLVGLVALVLLVNAGLHFWFSYGQEETAAFRFQQEKAKSAAGRIEEFIDGIEHQLGWTTAPQWAAAPVEQRQFDYVRLLRQVPAITELIQLDGSGKEQLRVSRLAMDLVGSGKDYSHEQSFIEAKANRIWFSPVYFRKESEPYLTLAMAQAGRNAGVTIAEVNLKLIWDVISGMKIGEGGYAYVIDRNGRLIAHPDISLVLRDTDMASLPQVAAVRVEALSDQIAPPAMVARNLRGEAVLTAHAAIVPLGWTVFVELPLREAMAPLYASAWQNAALLAVAIGLTTLAAMFLARRMVGPIRLLQAGAARIGAGELDRRIAIHTGDELEELAGTFNRMAGDLQKSYAELEQKVEDRTAELKEALDQQTATAEVLQVINSSPGDLTPVFDAMLEKAMRLCAADYGHVYTFDGEQLHTAAIQGEQGFVEWRRQLGPVRPHRGAGTSPLGRVMEGERVVHVADARQEKSYHLYPRYRELVDISGIRSMAAIALRKEDALLGAIVVYRRQVRPFTEKEIALLENFAAQAVIAMENARLINETHESLEQQQAIAEILQVINRSPGALQPVFEILLEKAMQLCGAAFGILAALDHERMHTVTARGLPPALAEWRRNHSVISTQNTLAARVLAGEPYVHTLDLKDDELYRRGEPLRRANVDLGGARTSLYVPLLRDRDVLGTIHIYRQEVRPFTDKQIALLQNFAAQAVIAMENARLLTETREALEQQTATAEVLQVINSSPGDLAPVFDAMLERALHLCEAAFGVLWTYSGGRLRPIAHRGVPALYADYLAGEIPAAGAGTGRARLLAGEPFVHTADLADDEPYRAGEPHRRAVVDLGGARTALLVPLRRDEAVIGLILIYRQEVRPFAEKQIALLQNFAAQAVIAMENARLLTETREALEQQTATAEVLQVINSSPGDIVPVFDAILEKAHNLCGAAHGALVTYDGEYFRTGALHAMPKAFGDLLRQPFRPYAGGAQELLLRGGPLVHIPDITTREPRTPIQRASIDAGVRTLLMVPLRKENVLLGYITAHRREVRPFTEAQIALLQNFAAQAVIAMENARLITETREALEQQTATAEVLQVINSSPGDLAPVFDSMLEKAVRLCDAAFGILWSYDGEHFHATRLRDVAPAFAEFLQEPMKPVSGGTFSRLIAGEAIAEAVDIVGSESYRAGTSRLRRAFFDLGGAQTALFVALRKDEKLLGAFTIYRKEIRPFTEKQIALVTSFAAQAVIAMENARLITETREALEQQTATAEVLQVINSSPGDLAPVFDAILEKAHTLCDSGHGTLFLCDGRHFRPAAMRGVPEPIAERLRGGLDSDVPLFRPLLDGERFVQVVDMAQLAHPMIHLANEAGVRALLSVPLRKGDELFGTIVAARFEARPFSEKQIDLLENFAAQAVIAMENARLITELRQRTHDLQESLEYQTATSDVLKVISRSVFDLQNVLHTVAATAIRLCRADSAVIYRNQGGEYRWLAGHMLVPEYEEIERRVKILPGTGTVVGRAALERRTVQILDARTDPLYKAKEDARVGGVHTMIGVPLLREGTSIGVIGLARGRVEAFSEREIQLVTTFADQAVIAIENARLFNELRARTAELGRSVEELKMLSEVGQAVSSTLDLRAVLSTILTRSVGLTGADAGAVFRYNRAGREFRLVEEVGWDETLARSVGDLRIAEAETAMGEAAARRVPIQIADLAQRARAPLRDASLAVGFRSVLIVPLVGPERILGAMFLQRRITGEFPSETVRLMQTLASQSVLAIQNARLFREIADKSEQLALASQHKSQFLANMSHELRTPLNAILGYAELLVDGIYGVLPERPKGVLDRIQNNGKHLLALINDVLDLAKIEAGQLTLTLEDYSLPEVIKSVVTATEPLATSKGLKFTAAVAENMPTAHGDARRVSQVLLNLAGNAIKFTDTGEVEIRAAVERSQFVLTVRDTGPGIADADQERIFGEFQQIDNTNTRKKGGTGLGLAISKRMVEMQGGTISVDSVLGHGSTFRVVLPVHVEAMLEEAA